MTTPNGWTKEKKISYAFWAAAAFALIAFISNSGTTTPPQPPSAPKAAPNGERTVLAGPHEDTLQKMALLINTRGELCARVETIKRIQGDVYAVQCVRFRDGTAMAVYEVNAATGAVK